MLVMDWGVKRSKKKVKKTIDTTEEEGEVNRGTWCRQKAWHYI